MDRSTRPQVAGRGVGKWLAASHRIEQDVIDNGLVIARRTDAAAEETVTKDVPVAAASRRIADKAGICRAKPQHHAGEHAAWILYEEVEVVCHQAEAVNSKSVVETERREH
ncbi:MAG TPA: hypothetical protein PLF26_03075 [Blastocatellia bacterium]|nr:hypothetical protein [Blastocatellia bacterium]